MGEYATNVRRWFGNRSFNAGYKAQGAKKCKTSKSFMSCHRQGSRRSTVCPMDSSASAWCRAWATTPWPRTRAQSEGIIKPMRIFKRLPFDRPTRFPAGAVSRNASTGPRNADSSGSLDQPYAYILSWKQSADTGQFEVFLNFPVGVHHGFHYVIIEKRSPEE